MGRYFKRNRGKFPPSPGVVFQVACVGDVDHCRGSLHPRARITGGPSRGPGPLVLRQAPLDYEIKWDWKGQVQVAPLLSFLLRLQDCKWRFLLRRVTFSDYCNGQTVFEFHVVGRIKLLQLRTQKAMKSCRKLSKHAHSPCLPPPLPQCVQAPLVISLEFRPLLRPCPQKNEKRNRRWPKK